MSRARSSISRFAFTALSVAFAALLCLTATAAAPPFEVTWQGVKAPMPQGCGWSAQATYNGKIYVFGGLTGTETETSLTLNTTQIYDPATDTWSEGAPMPTARYLATAAEVGGKIYVMGGRTIDSSGAGGPVDKNEAYDPATNTWTTRRALSAPIRGHMAAPFNGKVYVFGGNTGSYQRSVGIYNPSTDTWTSGAQMSAARAYGAAVAVPAKGRIYLMGGDNGGTTASKYYGNAVSYDPTANTWDSGTITMVSGEATSMFAACLAGTKIYIFPGQKWDTANNRDALNSYVTQALDTTTRAIASVNTLPPSPVVRTEAGATLVDGKIYVIGGTEAFRSVDVFDPAGVAWDEGNAPLPVFLDGANMEAIGDKLYVVNGGSSQGLSASVFSYDPAAGSWTQTPATNPNPRTGGVSDVYDGKIILAGGTDASTPRGDTQRFDPTTGSFTALATDPTATNLACGAVVSGVLYVFGGYDGAAGADVAAGRALDLTANTWSSKASLPAPMENATAVAYGGKIYIFGGFDNSGDDGLNDNVLIYDPAADAFTAGARMAAPVYRTTAAVYNNSILIYGGNNLYVQDTTRYYRPAPFLQVYDPAADAFTSTALVSARVDHAAAVIGDTLYATCGSDNTYLEDRLDIASLGAVGPRPLKATASADKTAGPVPLAVHFTGGATGGTPPYTFSWTFGDGDSSVDQSPSHTYDLAGEFQAALTVQDGVGGTASASLTIRPANVPPPVVTLVKKATPFGLIVTGSNLQSTIQVYINGAPWSGVTWKTTAKIKIGSGKALKAVVPKGQTTHLRFVNPDGGEATYDFSY